MHCYSWKHLWNILFCHVWKCNSNSSFAQAFWTRHLLWGRLIKQFKRYLQTIKCINAITSTPGLLFNLKSLLAWKFYKYYQIPARVRGKVIIKIFLFSTTVRVPGRCIEHSDLFGPINNPVIIVSAYNLPFTPSEILKSKRAQE